MGNKIITSFQNFRTSKQEQTFENQTFENTPFFSLENKDFVARVVDIYDGDTITIIIYLFQNYFKFTVRMSGIDTCEMKAKDKSNKEIAYKARNRLFFLVTGIEIDNIERKEVRALLNKTPYLVKIKCGEFDKYGRLLGEIYSTNVLGLAKTESFSTILIREKLAYAYDGKTKMTEKEQLIALKI